MKKSRIFQKKVLTICVVMLLAIILVIVYLPQKYLAALLPVQNLVDKTEINQEKEVKSAVHSNELVLEEDALLIEEETTPIEEDALPIEEETTPIEKETTNVSEDKTTAPPKDDANHQLNEMLHQHDVEDATRNGRDMSTDPEYQAQLREIYSEDDLKRMNAHRSYVILPNVVGKTEVDAVNTMHATGITPRVAYEDGGKKEGTVIRQEIPGGQEWNTDASIFIYVQRSKSVEPITKPSELNEPIDTSNTEVLNNDTNLNNR